MSVKPIFGPRFRPARWLRQWIAACKQNLTDEDLQILARPMHPSFMHVLADAGFTADELVALLNLTPLEVVAGYVRKVLPYKFDRGKPAVVEALADARRRGHGACADGSAAVAAAALLSGTSEHVVLCYESDVQDPGYAHVRVVVGTAGVDAYPDASWDISTCAERLDVRELVGWRARADKVSPD